MNLTIKLLRTIGSPFAERFESPQDPSEALQLYNHALKNKIGLLYLEGLKEQGRLGELESEYGEQCKKRSKILLTLARAAKLLDSAGIEYVIFKSNMPYPAITNDVDILLLGSDAELGRAAQVMLQSGYKQIGDEAPLEVMFHDSRDVPHADPREKDIYDVDLYKEVGATHIIYMDKRKLSEYTIQAKLLDEEVKILISEAELATMLIHSVFPEQIYTLMLYYAILYYVTAMSVEETERFIDLIKGNHIAVAARSSIGITAELHEAAHGFIPEEIQEILIKLGAGTSEASRPKKSNFETPHKYGMLTVIAALLEKMRERRARNSIIKQMLHMLNPWYAKYVVSVVIDRRKRETY